MNEKLSKIKEKQNEITEKMLAADKLISVVVRDSVSYDSSVILLIEVQSLFEECLDISKEINNIYKKIIS